MRSGVFFPIIFQQCQITVRHLFKFLVPVFKLKFLHNDNILLIYCCHKIFWFVSQKITYIIKSIAVLLMILSIVNTTRRTSVSICNFFGTIVNIYKKQVIQSRFLMKLSLSKRSLYATNRFWIWNAAIFPTMYTSSLPPFANSTYSNWCSSKILKTDIHAQPGYLPENPQRPALLLHNSPVLSSYLQAVFHLCPSHRSQFL